MSALPIRTARLPQVWPFPSLARIGAFLSLMADIFAEAQRSMREANRRYPFAGV